MRAGTDTERKDSAPPQGERAEAIASQSRSLRRGVITLAVFCVLAAGLLLGIPGLRSAAESVTDANPLWVAGGLLLELVSCAGYVVLFQLVFPEVDRRRGARLAMSELAMNSVVSVSGLAGLALGAVVLREEGLSMDRIARRSVVIFLLTSAANVAAVALIGIPMWLGAFAGSQDELITLLPAAAALVLIGGVLAAARWARGLAAELHGHHPRTAGALRALSGGVHDSVALLRGGDWRLAGAAVYWLADNAVLYACIAAFGHTFAPSFWAVAMAYLVGMLANSVPIPGGLIAVEAGLVGMLLAFGVRPASQVVAAVVIYRAISLWVPAIIGSVSFIGLRREMGRPLPDAAVQA